MSKLSPRQDEIANLIADGMDPAAIAEKLSLSKGTVHVHIAEIRKRKGLKSLLQISSYIWRKRKPIYKGIDLAVSS